MEFGSHWKNNHKINQKNLNCNTKLDFKLTSNCVAIRKSKLQYKKFWFLIRVELGSHAELYKINDTKSIGKIQIALQKFDVKLYHINDSKSIGKSIMQYKKFWFKVNVELGSCAERYKINDGTIDLPTKSIG